MDQSLVVPFVAARRSQWQGRDNRNDMDSAQHCRDQSAECLRLMGLAQSKDEAEILKNLCSSWSRLAGQIDRYHAFMREQGRRVVRK